jgi:hypothetical protein
MIGLRLIRAGFTMAMSVVWFGCRKKNHFWKEGDFSWQSNLTFGDDDIKLFFLCQQL